jgi:tetratricopeptide (TPR) repeat protein
MRQHLSQVGLLFGLFVLGCSSDRPRPPAVSSDKDSKNGRQVNVSDPGTTKPGTGTSTRTTTSPSADEVVASLPEPTKQQLYEQALHEAIDFLADRKYKDALTALEKAQKYQDTGTVQREIDKVRTVLAQEAAADKAVQDVRTVLDDGKPEEAARLAGSALSQYGGGDKAEDLARLKQEAEAIVTAAAPDETAVRRTSLKAEAERAIEDRNYRTAAVSLEQALALGDDPVLSKQLTEVRDKLQTYDENRRLAAELRRDPTRLEEAMTRLRTARKAWDTLQIQQEIEECQLVLERRRDRLSVADFEVLGEVGVANAGRTIAAELLPLFRPRFDLVERGQIARILNELNLEASDLGDSAVGRRELGRLARVRYLVVGSISSLGGVTLQARLVEVPTGLIVQTARISAPTVEALVPKLRQVALMLQMNDEQKLAFEEKLQNAVVAIKPIEAAPLAELPPPPPPPAPAAPPPPPIVTYSPRPPALGGMVIEDFRALPAVVMAPPPPPPALGLVIQRDDPRRHRLFRLSLELGDNCFRRGLFRDAHRHFSLALSIGGPRRELSLRLDSCRNFLPPPPPPPVVLIPPPVVREVIVPTPVIVAPPPSVVVVRPPVVILRPRVAVFGFLINCRPGLVPPAASELLAEQFASYCGGSYEIIDRGEVCWHMGRLGLTMREVMRDPISRRCLAQSLNARYFVFGAVQETASFNVETHLVDAETGARTGTGKIHVKDLQELKLRAGELARQIGANPADQASLAKKGAASEKALTEARGLLAKEPGKAADVARTALKANPDSVALQALVAEADRKAKLAKFEEDRRREAAAQAKALADAKKKQEELARAAAQARARAAADAAARTEAVRKQQQTQRERAAASLRAQAKQAQARGEHAQAVQLLQSATKLQANDELFRELAQATLAADKAARDKAVIEQKKRDDALKAQQAAAAKRVEADRLAREKTDAERKKIEETRAQNLHDGFLKQAKDEMARKDYAKAIAAAESARRYRATPESLKLINDARHEQALAEAKGAEKAKIEAERKKREAAERKLQQDREAYLAAIKKGQDALVAKKYDEAASQYQAAAKLFKTDAAINGLKVAEDLRARERARVDAENKAKEATARNAARLKELIDQGKKALSAREYAKAVERYSAAVNLAPGNVDAVAGLRQATRERDAEIARQGRQTTIAKHIAAGKASLAKKQTAEAIKSFNAALNLDPENAEARKLLADAQKSPIMPGDKDREEKYQLALGAGRDAMKKKNFAGAINAYNEALRHKPNDKIALAERDEAIKLDRASKVPPVDTAMKARQEGYKKAMDQARAAVKACDYAGAIKAFDQALTFMPKDPAATKERAEAVKLRTEAAYTIWMQKGQDGLKARKLDEAARAFDEALKLKPGDAAAIKGKKEASEGGKKPKPPPTDPKKVAYQKALTEARTLVAQKKYAEALRAFDTALKHMPGDPLATKERAEAVQLRTEAAYTIWMQRGQEHLKNKQNADAIKAFDEALKLKPGDAAAMKGKKDATPPPPPKGDEEGYKLAMGAARDAMKKKNYAGAINAYSEALRLKPGDKVATSERAEAVKLRTEAAYTIWMQRGQEHLKNKQNADAIKAFDEALKLKPGDAAAIKGKKEAKKK